MYFMHHIQLINHSVCTEIWHNPCHSVSLCIIFSFWCLTQSPRYILAGFMEPWHFVNCSFVWLPGLDVSNVHITAWCSLPFDLFSLCIISPFWCLTSRFGVNYQTADILCIASLFDLSVKCQQWWFLLFHAMYLMFSEIRCAYHQCNINIPIELE